jgi:hypothetical protein
VLNGIIAGDRDLTRLLDGLDPFDTAIVRAVLDTLT